MCKTGVNGKCSSDFDCSQNDCCLDYVMENQVKIQTSAIQYCIPVDTTNSNVVCMVRAKLILEIAVPIAFILLLGACVGYCCCRKHHH